MPKAAVEKAVDGDGGQKCPPLLEAWQERVKVARDAHDRKAREWEKNREYLRGAQHDDGKGGLVRTNLIYSNLSTIVPNVYAKNPEISVTPSASVSPARYRVVKNFASTLQIVIQRMMVEDARLKPRVRACLYSIYPTGAGWLKMFYQRDFQTDPLIKARINDTQDNLATIERLIRESEDPNETRSQALRRDELKAMVASLQQQVEVVVAEGLVIDRVPTDDIMVIDKTLTDWDQYTQAEAIDHMVWMSKDSYIERFCAETGWTKEGAPTVFTERSLDRKNDNGSPDKGTAELVCVHELWNMKINSVLTWGEGAKYYARPPYAPNRLAERWYPFFKFGWNFLDNTCDALPDISLQRELQDEYNSSRTQWAEHRADSMPVRIARANGGLTEDDLKAINNRKNREIVVIGGTPGKPLGDDIAEFRSIPLDPAVYDTNPIRGDMEMVSGRGDAAAGGVVEAKTATEAEIQQAGLMGRSDFRRDLIEDVIKDMATAAAQVCLQEMTVQQVQFLAGQDAVWPSMAKWEVFSLVNIDVRAGSTSKPNKAQEQQRWAELLPQIQQGMMQIAELKRAGEIQLAAAQRMLLKETLRKYDERFDLDELLGPEDEEGNAEAQQMQAMQQQLQEATTQLQQAQEQLQKVDQAKAAKDAAEAESKRMEFEARRQEASVKLEQDRVLAQQKSMELQSGDATKRALEEQRREFEHQRAIEETQRLADELRETITEKRAEIEAQAGTVDEMTAQAAAPIHELAQSLMAEIAEFQNSIAAINEQRQGRMQLVSEYLSGPRTPEALQSAVQRLAGAA